VNVKNPADLAVEVDFTALDTGAKQCTTACFENCSRQSKAVGMKETSNADSITNIELKHPGIIP